MSFSDDIKQKKQGITISKWIYIIIWIIVIWTWLYTFFWWNSSESINVSEIHIIEKWDLKIYVSWEWKVISWKKIELNFPIWGTIQWIYKSEGEEISTWEEIAKLDDSIYRLNLDRSNISLKNAYARLANKKEVVTESHIKVLEKSLDLANDSYESTKLKLSTNLANEKNNYNSLVIRRDNLVADIRVEQSNLELLILDENKKIENLELNLSFKWNTLILDINNYLNKIDELVWITLLNKNQNDSFDNYLWVKDTWLKSELISEFKILNNSVLENKDILSSNNKLLISYSDSLKDLLEKTIDVISNSIESTSFTSIDIQNYKSDFTLYLSNFELNRQSLLLAWDNLNL